MRICRDLEENEVVRVEDDKSLRRHFSNGDVQQGAMPNSVEVRSLILYLFILLSLISWLSERFILECT